MNRGRVLHHERLFRERAGRQRGSFLPPPPPRSRMDRLFERRVRLIDAAIVAAVIAAYVAALAYVYSP